MSQKTANRITLNIVDDIPMSIVGDIVKDLPESGVTKYQTPVGFVCAYKVDYRKTNVYQIWKEQINKDG